MTGIFLNVFNNNDAEIRVLRKQLLNNNNIESFAPKYIENYDKISRSINTIKDMAIRIKRNQS